jgi:hypothetical protein
LRSGRDDAPDPRLQLPPPANQGLQLP